jgi:lipopolysaccharide/colanic/teichoic acid biosynthesis glycosyltransferase
MSIDAPPLSLDDTEREPTRGSELHLGARESFFSAKAVGERLFAALLLVPAAPVIAVLILIVRWTSKGPGIYSQTRVGKDGAIFTMYKLRSMRCDAEAKTGAVWAGLGHDPRMTRVGYWLRRLHLDELPQLVNVIRGDMSLVGPRPERPEFVSILSDAIPGYLDRLAVKPGITGLAQINLPPDTDLDSVRRKLVLDREYIATAGWLLDFKITACTLLRLVGIRGGRAVAWLGLQRTVRLTDASRSEEEATPIGDRAANRHAEATADETVYTTARAENCSVAIDAASASA